MKADIFALGCTIFFVATNGKHPFGRCVIYIDNLSHMTEARIIEHRLVDLKQNIEDPLLLNLIQKMVG